MDIQSAQRYTRQTLAPYCTDDSDYLLAYSLGKDRAWLYAHSEYRLGSKQISRLKQLIERRNDGKPLAYLKGQQEFYGLNFYVNEAVLIPRPETEVAVAYAIDWLPQGGRLLDLGSGCGNIAIAIAYHRPDLHIVASDVSLQALDIARKNMQLHRCNITLKHSDWYQNIDEHFDWIISNPPYIAAGDVDADDREISAEPELALYAEDNGCAALKAVIAGARNHLKRQATLLIEHSPKQATITAQLMQSAGFTSAHCLKDIASLQRYTIGR
ncbi:MAG: peptide chain release factor N(5)-glutamine methyltransferase [Chromatiales bacterium]|nr:peptide chain release factor N(5)-glutamine methyltransferase [Chromatiales bacterium]